MAREEERQTGREVEKDEDRQTDNTTERQTIIKQRYRGRQREEKRR